MAIIQIEDLSYRYDKFLALKNICMDVSDTGLVCLVGPNGSGKSTLLKCIAGLMNVPDGKIFVEGRDIRKYKAREMAVKISYVPQINQQAVGFSVREVVMMGRYPHSSSVHDKPAVDYALEMTDMTSMTEKDCSQLSGGEYQRMMIARCLAQQSSIMLLDEPISHLDIRYQIEIMETLNRISQENNKLIITSIHDLNFAAIYGKEIILLDNGKKFNTGSPEKVLNIRNVKDVYHTELSTFSPDGITSLFYPVVNR